MLAAALEILRHDYFRYHDAAPEMLHHVFVQLSSWAHAPASAAVLELVMEPARRGKLPVIEWAAEVGKSKLTEPVAGVVHAVSRGREENGKRVRVTPITVQLATPHHLAVILRGETQEDEECL